ncbi:MAG: glycoside hydrolase family 31 protein [Clostridia bacterium]|nr:glycoside hydrolase family 31 protein [Clostridia bacterium]
MAKQTQDEFLFDFGGLPCRLTYTGNHGWRLQTAKSGVFSDFGAGQILARDLKETPCLTKEPIQVLPFGLNASDGSSVRLDEEGLVLYTPSGRKAVRLTGVEDNGVSTSVFGVFSPDERIFGTGERFDRLNRRGLVTEIFASDRWLQWEGNSYVPIPLLVSSEGHGLFLNRFERCLFDLDTSGDGSYELRVMGNVPMDLYLFASDRMSDVLYGYSVLSGFCPEPAEWLYGTQVCRYSPDFSNPEGILAMRDAMKENDFPWEAVIVEGWDTYDPNRNAALAETARELAKDGKRLMMYHFCGKIPGNAESSFGAKPEYFVHRKEDGSVQLPQTHSFNPADNPEGDRVRTHVYVDITNPEAVEWWQKEVWGPLTKDALVRGSKIDFCELFPDDEELVFHDGRETSGAHHWYPTLYNTLMYRYYSSLPGGGMNFSRGGGIGAQRYPFLWAGDQLREWFYLHVILRGVLTAGLSGIPFMSFDMGGYRPARNQETDPEDEVFVRGIEFGCFTANIQTHGKVMRPYDFEAPVKQIYRVYAKAHDLLRPYLVEQGRISSKTGLPLMRALALWDGTDPACLDCEDEYLLGDGFLVAPILDRTTERDIYLPKGSWEELLSGRTIEGPVTLRHYPADLTTIPVFVNRDSKSTVLKDILPMLKALLDSLSGDSVTPNPITSKKEESQ